MVTLLTSPLPVSGEVKAVGLCLLRFPRGLTGWPWPLCAWCAPQLSRGPHAGTPRGCLSREGGSDLSHHSGCQRQFETCLPLPPALGAPRETEPTVTRCPEMMVSRAGERLGRGGCTSLWDEGLWARTLLGFPQGSSDPCDWTGPGDPEAHTENRLLPELLARASLTLN